jgi:RNA polymerase sigma-70 factor (ECF subfamily)
LESVDRRKGKFRAFLLAALKHFLANEYNRTQAKKRGGGQAVIHLDALDAETRYGLEPADNLTPDKLFERRWALAVLERVLARLEAESVAAGQTTLFEALKGFLTGGAAQTYAAVGRELGMTEGAIKVAVHRLRRRYRALLRDEIAQTLVDPQEIDDEIRYLLSCL